MCRQNNGYSPGRKFEQMWLREEEHFQIAQNSWKADNRHLTDKLSNTLAELHS
jgi:hypothetical protein